jgi:hypothetical protein
LPHELVLILLSVFGFRVRSLIKISFVIVVVIDTGYMLFVPLKADVLTLIALMRIVQTSGMSHIALVTIVLSKSFDSKALELVFNCNTKVCNIRSHGRFRTRW